LEGATTNIENSDTMTPVVMRDLRVDTIFLFMMDPS